MGDSDWKARIIKLSESKGTNTRQRILIQVPKGAPHILNGIADQFWKACEDIALSPGELEKRRPFALEAPIFFREEINAWRLLIQDQRAWPFWKHLSKFNHNQSFLFMFVHECIVEPYYRVRTKRIDYAKQELEESKARYCEISEACDNLRDLLYAIPHHDQKLYEDIGDFLEQSELDRLLLKLLSMTTACEWPALEYQNTYEGNSEISMHADDTKRHESYSVYRHTTVASKTISDRYQDKEWVKFAYRRLDPNKNQNAYDDGENEDGTEHVANEDVVYKEPHECPPTFEPPQLDHSIDFVRRARASDAQFLRLATLQMDNFSVEYNLDFSKFNKFTTIDSALWLNIDSWLSLITIFFQSLDAPVPDSSSSQASKVKTTVYPSRACHIKDYTKKPKRNPL